MGGRVSACDSGAARDKASLNGISRTRWCDRAEWGGGWAEELPRDIGDDPT